MCNDAVVSLLTQGEEYVCILHVGNQEMLKMIAPY